MNTKIFLLLALSFVSYSVSAESTATKAPTRIDFNQMIEQNSRDSSDLHAQMTEANSAAQVANAKGPDVASEKRRTVIDFIDMEVGVGDDAHVVDRR